MRGDVGEQVVVCLTVDLGGSALISAVDGADVGNAAAGIFEADHGVKAAGAVVVAVALLIAPALAGHPEVLIPAGACLGGVVLSPIVKRGDALGFELLPGSLLNVLGGIAAEAVDAVGLYPVGEPAGDVAGDGVGAAVFAYFGVIGAVLFPFVLQEGRNGNLCVGFGSEVRQTGKAHLLVAAAALRVARQTAAYPVGAPPSSPGSRGVGVVNRVVQAVDAGELVEIGFRRGLVLEGTEVELHHILDGVVAGVVHNDIHDDTDIVLVRGVNQILEVLLG